MNGSDGADLYPAATSTRYLPGVNPARRRFERYGTSLARGQFKQGIAPFVVGLQAFRLHRTPTRLD